MVETYGDISIIAVPGIETLTESERIAFLEKAQRRLIPDYLDANALYSRLQAITPPPDKEEDDEESRVLEAQARQDLESDDCLPCYPPCLNVPIRNPPEQYRQIIEYWESFSGTGDVVLCAQRSDWQKFRQFQQRLRHRNRNKLFSVFLDELRERRRAHKLDDNVHLLLDPRQQNRKQTWIEFQDYHLRLHERMEKQQEGLQVDLDNSQEKSSGIDMEPAVQQERAIHQRLDYVETTLQWHKVMLSWIEQCRLAMDPLLTARGKKGGSKKNSLAILGNVRVSKSTPKQTRTPILTTFERISSDSAITMPSGGQNSPPNRPRRSQRLAVLGNVSKSTPKRTRTSKTTIFEPNSSDAAITMLRSQNPSPDRPRRSKRLALVVNARTSMPKRQQMQGEPQRRSQVHQLHTNVLKDRRVQESLMQVERHREENKKMITLLRKR
ncbi:hypothetical protein P154DRAFT_516643 [Amniculicola lignicola CBS 123094]|uniref:Uncharacterized protein n=1 Tax=Amniculicola lignicola CBS 123094 TaxID=1392246 RepID=A0A6A5X4N7_9PLEO|nr:hypothetical protein P154DRAFT_516643 [Amniculicola lignicola CBS 123094]